MAKKNEKINAVDLLLSQLDKEELANFIRKECSNNRQFENRFLALGVGTLFRPDPEIYVTRVENLIKKYGGRYGHIEYSGISDFSDSVLGILSEATDAMKSGHIVLYASEVNAYFRRANCRSSYRNAVKQLRTLIGYDGEKEAQQIVADQMSHTPRRPALIDELSKL